MQTLFYIMLFHQIFMNINNVTSINNIISKGKIVDLFTLILILPYY